MNRAVKWSGGITILILVLFLTTESLWFAIPYMLGVIVTAALWGRQEALAEKNEEWTEDKL